MLFSGIFGASCEFSSILSITELSDSNSPLDIIVNNGWKNVSKEITILVENYNVSKIVVGLPITLKNQHGACPGCGGKDRFRFDNLNGDGSFICSQGGLGEIAGDGFELLIHAGKAASKSEALRLVADHLGHAGEPSKASPPA